MNYYILIIGVNIQYVISNKDVKVCKSLCGGSRLLSHYTLVDSLFPIAELWIVKCMQLTLTVCDGQLTGRSESVSRQGAVLELAEVGAVEMPERTKGMLPSSPARLRGANAEESAESNMPAL